MKFKYSLLKYYLIIQKIKTTTIVIAAALITVMMIGIGPFISAKTTKGNVHLDAAMNALNSGDSKGALKHMDEADKTLTGSAKTHLDAAISALNSGNLDGAKMHLKLAQDNL